jgi:hypothetical protein
VTSGHSQNLIDPVKRIVDVGTKPNLGQIDNNFVAVLSSGTAPTSSMRERS